MVYKYPSSLNSQWDHANACILHTSCGIKIWLSIVVANIIAGFLSLDHFPTLFLGLLGKPTLKQTLRCLAESPCFSSSPHFLILSKKLIKWFQEVWGKYKSSKQMKDEIPSRKLLNDKQRKESHTKHYSDQQPLSSVIICFHILSLSFTAWSTLV